MKQFLVLGCGHFGSALAKKLYALGHEVVVMDEDKNRIDEVMHDVGHTIVGDATDEDTLLELDIPQFDTVVVSIGESLEANILATYACKQAGAKHIISKVDTELASDVLTKVGADHIVRPEYDMALRLASTLSSPNVLEQITLLEQLTLENSDYSIARLQVNEAFTGKLQDLALPQKYHVQVIMVEPYNAKKSRESQFLTINGQTILKAKDNIIVIGSDKAIFRLNQELKN